MHTGLLGGRKENVQIQEHTKRGKILVTTRPFVPGQEILIEAPVIIVPWQNSCWGPKPVALARVDPHFWFQYCSYLEQSPSTQQQILSFYSPVDCQKAIFLRRIALMCPEVNADLFVKVAMVFQFNAANISPEPKDGGTRKSIGVGLFNLACRVTHSCQPNCFWLSSPRGQRIIIAIHQSLPSLPIKH